MDWIYLLELSTLMLSDHCSSYSWDQYHPESDALLLFRTLRKIATIPFVSIFTHHFYKHQYLPSISAAINALFSFVFVITFKSAPLSTRIPTMYSWPVSYDWYCWYRKRTIYLGYHLTSPRCMNECRKIVLVLSIHISALFNEHLNGLSNSWKWMNQVSIFFESKTGKRRQWRSLELLM